MRFINRDNEHALAAAANSAAALATQSPAAAMAGSKETRHGVPLPALRAGRPAP